MLILPPIFSDYMILQQAKKVCIWGTASPGDAVTVQIPEHSIENQTIADETGQFAIYVDEQTAGDEVTVIVKTTSEQKVFKHVLYGEVWLAAGQSNMEFELQNCMQAKAEKNWCMTYPEAAGKLRMYYVLKVPYETAQTKQAQANVRWVTLQEEQAGRVSAVAYFAAKLISEKRQVPVGIINCNHGGTSISCWMTQNELCSFSAGQQYWNRYHNLYGQKTKEQYDREMELYQKQLHTYLQCVEKQKAEAKEQGNILSQQEIDELCGNYPWPEPQSLYSVYRPGGLAVSMFSTIARYTINGVWYYQGEEDSANWDTYEEMLNHLILFWRQHLKCEIPFGIVQLPMYCLDKDCDDGSWVQMREIQKRVAEENKNCYFVPLCDLGEYDNIHPIDKKTPGTRLGKVTLQEVYAHRTNLYMQYHSVDWNDSTMIVQFSNVGDEIYINEAKQGDEVVLMPGNRKLTNCFEAILENGKTVGIQAVICETTVYITCMKEQKIKGLRYGWHNFARTELYNSEGYPLLPFSVEFPHSITLP